MEVVGYDDSRAMPECPGCGEGLDPSEEYTYTSWELTRQCPSCGRDVDLPRSKDDERRAERRAAERREEVLAADRDGTCISCGAARSRWSRLTWSKCGECDAPHCRKCKKTTFQRGWGEERWTCLHCDSVNIHVGGGSG